MLNRTHAIHVVYFKEYKTWNSENIAVYLLLCIYTITLISIIYSYHKGQFILYIWAAFKAKDRSLGKVNDSWIV